MMRESGWVSEKLHISFKTKGGKMHKLDAVLERGAVRLLADTRTSLPTNREPQNQFVTFAESVSEK